MENYSQCPDFLDTQPSSPETPAYEVITTDNKKTYKCLAEKCEKVFRFKSDMERHTIVHTKDRPFVCKYAACGKSFKRPDALKNHLQTHNEGLPFVCLTPGCNLRFHKRSALQYHLLKHNDEKFLCDSPGCQKSFLTTKQLNQHKNQTGSQQKFIPLKQEVVASEDFDCFLSHFEDRNPEQNTSTQNPSTRNSFNDGDNFSPKSEKFLHTETGRAACPHPGDSPEEDCKLSDLSSPKTSSKLCFKDFVQLMICKYLLDENQQMKAKLDIKTDHVKAKFENRLNCMLKQALSRQFNMSEAVSSTN